MHDNSLLPTSGATQPELRLSPLFALKVLSIGEGTGAAGLRAAGSFESGARIGARSGGGGVSGVGGPVQRATLAAAPAAALACPVSPLGGHGSSGHGSVEPAAPAVERFVFEVTQAFPSSGKPKPSVFLAADSAAERDKWVKAVNDGKRNVPRGPRTMV